MNDENEKTRSLSIVTEGQKIGHYRVVRKISSGGMGEVYLAEDTALNRNVAIKFLPATVSGDAERRARFAREAQAAAKLSHPNIITIYEVSEYEGRPFFAMEYVEGESLAERIKLEDISPEKIIGLTVQICEGLQKAHQAGITHRDLKPSNIVIDSDGRIKILDFGLAAVKGDKKLTRSGQALGTIYYMSPEQTRGGEIDYRSDIFSLGVVLYELITGHLPFRGDNEASVLNAIANNIPEPLARYKSGVPDELQRIVEKTLAKDPDYRYQSAADLASDLKRIGSGAMKSIAGKPAGDWWNRYVVIPAVAVLSVIAGYWLITNYFIPKKTPSNRMMLAVLPFVNMTSKPDLNDWPGIIQALIVSSLTGVTEFGVADPMSLNTLIKTELDTVNPQRGPLLYKLINKRKITYLVDGAIVEINNQPAVQASIVDPRTGERLFSRTEQVKDEGDLPRATGNLSQGIFDYIQTVLLRTGQNRDLQAWMSHREIPLGALKAFMQAGQFIFNGLPGSEKYLRQALEIDSLFVAPRIWLISGLVSRGETHEAENHYRFLLEHGKDIDAFEQAMISWAGAFLENDIGAQIRALQLALEYSPGNNILLYQLARSHYAQKDFRAAIATLKPALEMKWNFPAAYYLIGGSYCSLGEYDKARDILEKSLSFSPVFPYSYGLLSALACLKGDSLTALRYEDLFIREMKTRKMDLGQIYGMLGENHINIGACPGAIRCFRLAIALRPGVAENHANLGEALYRTGDFKQAEEEYLQSLKLDFNQAYPYRMLGEIYESRGDTPRAVQYYQSYVEHDSSSSYSVDILRRLARLRR